MPSSSHAVTATAVPIPVYLPALDVLLPYQTDAPVDHPPLATIGLIVANVIVFVLVMTGTLDYESLALQYGKLVPIQWVTSNFLHAGILHLLGNMIFLWVFGLVVEGKVGALPFLLLYFGIGLAECAVEQLLMLGAEEGCSLGASSILFGLLGIAMIWAPKNHVDVWYWFFIWVGTFTVTTEAAAYIFLGFEVFYQIVSMVGGIHLTSMLLHLMGAAIGVPLGVFMLKKGYVDCEGWDWFSMRNKV
jgi:membrane associated rhomboid family serine protease